MYGIPEEKFVEMIKSIMEFAEKERGEIMQEGMVAEYKKISDKVFLDITFTGKDTKLRYGGYFVVIWSNGDVRGTPSAMFKPFNIND